MKTLYPYFLLVLFVVSASLPAEAQKYAPREQTVQFGKTSANAWVVAVDDEPLDALKKSWSGYVKQQLNVKTKKEGRDELEAKEVTLPLIYAHKGDLKAKFFVENDVSFVAVAFMPGYDIALNTQEHPQAADNLRRFTKNFIKQYKTKVLTEQIATSEKREKAIEKEYRKNEREHQQLTKHVARLDKQMRSNKTEENKKFDLNNQKVEDKSRMAALATVMKNQKSELGQINQTIQGKRSDISYLEKLFADPLADQKSTPIE